MADQKDDDEDIAEELAFEELKGTQGGSTVAARFLAAKAALLRKQLAQLHLSHFREWLYASAEMVLGLVILLIFAGIASAVWSAAHDNGLVIESFSVPSDMANRGMTGEVVASRLLDKLSLLQARTVSSRAASSYANDWGKDIKVQIPETGVSIGQLNDYLHEWLGNVTHISGDVYRDSNGNISLSARVGSDAGPTFTGKEADFDKLLQKAAESVYARTQPYRYAVYLSSLNLADQSRADAVYRKLAEDGSLQDRAWAYVGISNIYQNRNQSADTLRVLFKALALRPNFAMAIGNIAGEYGNNQNDEQAYQWNRKVMVAFQNGDATDMDPKAAAGNAANAQATIAQFKGDFQEELKIDNEAENQPGASRQMETIRETDVTAYALMHDARGVRNAMADNAMTTDQNTQLNRTAVLMGAYYALGRWNDTLALVDALEVFVAKFGLPALRFEERSIRPTAAVAMAMTGDMEGAEKRIAHTSLDCDFCVRARGRLATIAHRWGAAAYWYNMVAARSPSIPFADTDWGMMLLAKGDPAAAIEKFKSAHEKGPHFADPLEGWGEALMMQNHSDRALAEFEDAAKYAPNWGRLHLKWGEALLYTGDKQDAKKQFAIASGLDLTQSEKSELDRMNRTHG